VAKIAISPDMPNIELNQSGSGVGVAVRRVANRFLMRHAILVAMTDAIEGGLRDWGARRIVRIPNGVDEPPDTNREVERAALFEAAGILDGNAQVVAAAGRLTDQKGFDRLLDAWSLVASTSNRHLVILGDGPDLEALQQQAARLGISDTVHFANASPEQFRRWVGWVDGFVVSSRYEGMANVLLEAMVAGVPVVSTPVSGSTDL